MYFEEIEATESFLQVFILGTGIYEHISDLNINKNLLAKELIKCSNGYKENGMYMDDSDIEEVLAEFLYENGYRFDEEEYCWG